MNKSVAFAFVSAAFLTAGAVNAGVAYASETPGITSPSSAAVMQSAYTNLVSGNAEQAIAEYTVAINHSDISVPDRARALLNRALANQKIDAHEAAIADYSSAIELDALSPKTRAVALYNRGISNSKLNKLAYAVDDYTNALYLDPYLAEAYYSRANALRDSGQYDYALIDYAKAAKFNYRLPHLALYGTALTLASLGHNDEATAALFKVYSLKPDFQPAREKLSELGVDVPENPSRQQIKLAVLPSQNLLADDIVTGSAAAPSNLVRQAALREPVAPPAGLISAPKPDTLGAFIANTDVKPALQKVAVVAPAPTVANVAKPEDISVSQVAPVPAIPKKVASAQAVAPATVQVEPVSASVQTGASNLTTETPGVSKKLEGWTVQLVSQRDADKAWSNWTSLLSRHSKLLGGKTAAVIRADVDGQGTYYRLRVHKLEKSEANSLCKSLKRKGTGCFVSRAAG